MRLPDTETVVRCAGGFVLGVLLAAAGYGVGGLARDMPPYSPVTWLLLGCTCFTVLVLASVAIIVMVSVIDYRKAKRRYPFAPVAETIAKPETVVAAPQRPGPPKHPPRPKDRLGVQVIDGPLSPINDFFYLDEHLSNTAVLGMFRKHKLKVVSTYEADRGGSSDEGQLRFAARSRRRIVTCDKDFLALHKKGIPHAGIVHAPPGPEWYPEILRVCLALAGEVIDA
jgi:Domain of unknown function (DUF5615)